jgi:hypothetical protein
VDEIVSPNTANLQALFYKKARRTAKNIRQSRCFGCMGFCCNDGLANKCNPKTTRKWFRRLVVEKTLELVCEAAFCANAHSTDKSRRFQMVVAAGIAAIETATWLQSDSQGGNGRYYFEYGTIQR